MKIGPKTTESVTQICAEVEKIAELPSKGIPTEGGNLRMPRMSLETVMPRRNIIRGTGEITPRTKEERDSMIHRLIYGFKDISDTKTIGKICTEWDKDLEQMSKEFLTEKLQKEGLLKKHQDSLKTLNKYQLFADKIYKAILNSPGNKREALSVFEKYIEPIVLKTQETLKTIDNIPEVKKAYMETSERATGIHPIPAVKTNPAPEQVVQTTVNENKNNTIADELESQIPTINSISDASRLMTKLEANKELIPIEKFEELGQRIIDKIQKRG